MIKIVFKNLEKSELARRIVDERITPVLEKFSVFDGHNVTVTLEMENSPTQAGPDYFKVSTLISGPVFKNIRFEKSSENLYLATAEASDGIQALLGKKTLKVRKTSKSGTIKHITEESIYD
jgi:ribosome-associated translation inhibitor RaiA